MSDKELLDTFMSDIREVAFSSLVIPSLKYLCSLKQYQNGEELRSSLPTTLIEGKKRHADLF